MFLVWNLHPFLGCIFFFTWLEQTFFKISLFYFAQLLKRLYVCTNKIKQIMIYAINSKLNKTGKRKVFYPTIDGKRLNNTNFTKKWEAINFAKHCVEILKNK